MSHKAPVSSSSESQKSSAIKLTTTSIPSAREKHEKIGFLFSKYHPEWCNNHKQWQHTVLWDTKKTKS